MSAQGNGVLGFGGGVNSAANAGGTGVRGIGAGGQIVNPPLQNGFPNPVGVFGVGGGSCDPNFQSPTNGAGVVGVGGSANKPSGIGNAADGVQGYGVGSYSGVAGFGDPMSNGTGVLGVGGGDRPDSEVPIAGPGVRGIGGGSGISNLTNPIPNRDGSPNPVGVFGLGGLGESGNLSADGVQGVGVGQGAGVAGYGMTFDTTFKPSPNKTPQCGVYGQGGTTKVLPGAIGTAAGVVGVGGTGVNGYSVDANGIGVAGEASGIRSYGVSGTSDPGFGVSGVSNSGTGVYGVSDVGRGGVFASSNIAALRLKPLTSVATPQGVIAGELGDLYVSQPIAGQGNLWFCSTTGDATTAKWVKVA